MQQQMRTSLLHERTSSASPDESGSRYWIAAQLLSTTWFVAETCVEVSGANETLQWVTPSIRYAVCLQQSLRPYIWGRIYICVRAPHGIPNGTLFEVLREAYQAGSRDSYVFLLENGKSFLTGTESPQGIGAQPEELKLIYAKGR